MDWDWDNPFPIQDNDLYMTALGGILSILITGLGFGMWYFGRIPSAERGRRVRGCSCPLDESQLTLCAVFVLETLVFYSSVALPCYDLYSLNVCAIAHWATFALLIGLFSYLEHFDPAAKSFDDPLPIPCYCEECGDWFVGRRRKHCYNCNKCVLGFDHHCHYINQCIGTANYRPWLLFIIVAFALSASQAVMSTVAIVRSLEQSSTCSANVQHYIGLHLFVGLAGGCITIQFMGAFALGSLIQEQFRVILTQIRNKTFVSSFMWWGHSYKQEHHVEVIHQALINWRYNIIQRAIVTMRRNHLRSRRSTRSPTAGMTVELPDEEYSVGFWCYSSYFTCCKTKSFPEDSMTHTEPLVAGDDVGPLDLTGSTFETAAYQSSASKKLDRDFWLMNATLSGFLNERDILNCSRCVEWEIPLKECAEMISLARRKSISESKDGPPTPPAGSKIPSFRLVAANTLRDAKADDSSREDVKGISLSDYRSLMNLSQPLPLTTKDLQNVFCFLGNGSSISFASLRRAVKQMSFNTSSGDNIHAAYAGKCATTPASRVKALEVPDDELASLVDWAAIDIQNGMDWHEFLAAIGISSELKEITQL